MKILLISMPSIHVIRWIENLDTESNEVYWFDVLDKGELKTASKITQITSWKKRKIPYIMGEYWFSKKNPKWFERIKPFLEVTVNEALEEVINSLQPDVVHSFEMQSCSYPILKTMNKYSSLKWIYSCWGSDLFYYQNFKDHQNKIKCVLKRVDYLITDCARDYEIAKKLEFRGEFLGIIPGGAGFKLKDIEKDYLPLEERKIILVKGYEHKFGRGLNVIKALFELKNELKNFEIVVFGAHQKVINYILANETQFKYYERHGLSHAMLIELMGKSIIYIGNNISDGMPNTLLEAITMGVFPIQSNPGGVTQEIIRDGKNGMLISNAEDINEIKLLVLQAVGLDFDKFRLAQKINKQIANSRLDYKINQFKIRELYRKT